MRVLNFTSVIIRGVAAAAAQHAAKAAAANTASA